MREYDRSHVRKCEHMQCLDKRNAIVLCALFVRGLRVEIADSMLMDMWTISRNFLFEQLYAEHRWVSIKFSGQYLRVSLFLPSGMV